jgi:flagellin FlaB
MIDTANLVVQQAQETGTKATAEISSGLKIVNIAGDRNNPIVFSTDASNSTWTYTGALPGANVNITIYVSNWYTTTETWTVTCSSGGADAATFWVNGSKSGNIATVQSGSSPGTWGSASPGPDASYPIAVRIWEPVNVAENYTAGEYFTFTTTKAVGKTENNIQVVELKIRLHAGSPSIAIENMIIEITDGNVSVNLAYKDVTSNFSAQANATHYTAEAIRDTDNTWSTSRFISSATLVKIYINCNASNLELDPQTKVIMKMIPRQGVTTYEEFITPDSYAADRYIIMT